MQEESALFSTMSLGISGRFAYADEQRSIQTMVSRQLNKLDVSDATCDLTLL